jgi:transcription elongation GreA/GreB family factor
VRPAAAGGKARFGSVVVLERGDGRRLEYRIVGEDEADPSRGKISYVSPIARLLIEAQAGDEIELPDGVAQIREVR